MGWRWRCGAGARRRWRRCPHACRCSCGRSPVAAGLHTRSARRSGVRASAVAARLMGAAGTATTAAAAPRRCSSSSSSSSCVRWRTSCVATAPPQQHRHVHIRVQAVYAHALSDRGRGRAQTQQRAVLGEQVLAGPRRCFERWRRRCRRRIGAARRTRGSSPADTTTSQCDACILQPQALRARRDKSARTVVDSAAAAAAA